MKLRLFIFTVFIATLLTSCGLLKNHQTDPAVIDKTDSVKVDKHAFKPDPEVVKFVEALKPGYLKYETLAMKFSGEILDNENNSTPLKGIIRMKRDSFVWISVRPGLGIELARASFTTDSVKFLDRMKSTYFAGSYAFTDSAFSVYTDYNMIQSLLTNQFFVYHPDKNLKPDYGKFKIKKMAADTELFYKDSVNTNAYEQIVRFSADMKILQVSALSAALQRNVVVNYSDFVLFNNANIAKHIEAVITEKGKTTKMILDLSDFELNMPAKYTFKIPNSYTPMSLKKK
jgi:hypothetical protein